ncbi:MAG TPA: cytochrome d ubiquinol oxidase subunit II [Jatrophihabitantaceae bacterium]|jgi:cytochrome d ubiquinol oxidase subunit II
MALATLWFWLVAVLWVGFFVLEGFDLGVGALHAVVGRTDAERRAAIDTIGPFWDGNEVWLVVAAAGMFAAFPGWYATMFSGFYLLFAVVLAALIARGVSFEFRGKFDGTRWRGTWDVSMSVGSLVVAAGLGVALGDLLHGVPIDQNQEFTGSLADVLQPYALYTGLTLVMLCLVHGSTFLALTTGGVVRTRARRLAARTAPAAGLVVLGFVIWTRISEDKGVLISPLEACAILAVFAAAWLASETREGWAFVATTVALATTVASIFVDLYPRVMVSSTNSAYSLTVDNTASGSYALKVMTIVAVVLLPVVLFYQGWSYHIFHRRVTRREPIETASVPQS